MLALELAQLSFQSASNHLSGLGESVRVEAVTGAPGKGNREHTIVLDFNARNETKKQLPSPSNCVQSKINRKAEDQQCD
jgi:hypothetical protein